MTTPVYREDPDPDSLRPRHPGVDGVHAPRPLYAPSRRRSQSSALNAGSSPSPRNDASRRRNVDRAASALTTPRSPSSINVRSVTPRRADTFLASASNASAISTVILIWRPYYRVWAAVFRPACPRYRSATPEWWQCLESYQRCRAGYQSTRTEPDARIASSLVMSGRSSDRAAATIRPSNGSRVKPNSLASYTCSGVISSA